MSLGKGLGKGLGEAAGEHHVAAELGYRASTSQQLPRFLAPISGTLGDFFQTSVRFHLITLGLIPCRRPLNT